MGIRRIGRVQVMQALSKLDSGAWGRAWEVGAVGAPKVRGTCRHVPGAGLHLHEALHAAHLPGGERDRQAQAGHMAGSRLPSPAAAAAAPPHAKSGVITHACTAKYMLGLKAHVSLVSTRGWQKEQ
jgi:hypothetical protein